MHECDVVWVIYACLVIAEMPKQLLRNTTTGIHHWTNILHTDTYTYMCRSSYVNITSLVKSTASVVSYI